MLLNKPFGIYVICRKESGIGAVFLQHLEEVLGADKPEGPQVLPQLCDRLVAAAAGPHSTGAVLPPFPEAADAQRQDSAHQHPPHHGRNKEVQDWLLNARVCVISWTDRL